MFQLSRVGSSIHVNVTCSITPQEKALCREGKKSWEFLPGSFAMSGKSRWLSPEEDYRCPRIRSRTRTRQPHVLLRWNSPTGRGKFHFVWQHCKRRWLKPSCFHRCSFQDHYTKLLGRLLSYGFIFHPEGRGTRLIRNVGNSLPNYTVSDTSYLPLSEPQISRICGISMISKSS